MKSKEIFEKKIERETFKDCKIDLSLLRKKSSATTSAGVVLGYMKKLKNADVPLEFKILLQEMYKKIWSLEESEKIKIESWRKKGGIKVWATPDKIIVEFAGPRDKNEKPNIQRKEYTKQEINQMILCINNLKEEFNNKIPSRDLGEAYFNGNWDLKVFSNRKNHTKFCHLLNILDYYYIIRYNRGGFTSVIKEVREIQEVLTP